MHDDKTKKIKAEDFSKYGEYVCSLNHWLPIDKQKERSEKLVDITEKKPK